MMRVLTLSSLFPDQHRPVFGVFVERQTLGLAAYKNVHVEVISPIGMPPWPLSRHPHYHPLNALPLQENWKGVQVHRPRFTVFPGTNGRFSAAAMSHAILPLARKLHARQRFDVIDAEFFYPDGPAAMRIAKTLGIPFSIKARGADIHYWGHQSSTANKVIAAGNAANGLLAVSAALKKDMIALGMPGDVIKVHYTGVDLDRFKPGDRSALKAQLGISGPLIVTLGALIPRKNQSLVLNALALLPGVTAIFVGEGSDRMTLQAQAQNLGIADRVRMPGNLPHDQLPAILAAADAMVLPSSSEGLANAWVEALACGTPIIIADIGGARELIDRPEAGHIVPRDSTAIARAVTEILRTSPDPNTIRETALRFTWAANSDALYAHLSGLCRR